MWRSRARLGLCAIVVALAWPAPARAGGGGGTGTWYDSAATVQASAATTLDFTYTAPANPPSLDLTVTIGLPGDWMTTASATVSCQRSDCSVTAQSSTQIVVQMNLDVATTFVLYYPAMAPGYATSESFTATEEFGGNPPATDQLASLPITVDCPADGTGTMTVYPSAVTAGSSQTLTFTYTAGSCGVGAGGLVALTVPGGWTTPSMTAGTTGYVTWAGAPVTLNGSTVTVPVGQLAPGQQVTIYYEMPQAPASSGGYTFTAAEQSGTDGSLQDLASSPPVTVTPLGGIATAPASHGGGTPTAPASHGGGTSTAPATPTAPASHGGGTPTVSASTSAVTVKTAHSPIDWLPIVVLVIGLVLAAGTAGRLTFRRLRRGWLRRGWLRRGGHGAVAADVRTVPHTGPPATVVIRDTGRRPALTVRIEPHAGAAVTTIEETRP